MLARGRGKTIIKGERVLLRPVQERDWAVIEGWGSDREALWGGFQRFQLDHLPLLRQAFEKTRLLKRESGLLLVETIGEGEVVGFVRYSLIPYPDADSPYPEVGFGIPARSARGKGYAKEALALLVRYLFSGYPVERIVGFTDSENTPSQRVMEGIGFRHEGTLRRAKFRDGQWRDIAIFGLLRPEWQSGGEPRD